MILCSHFLTLSLSLSLSLSRDFFVSLTSSFWQSANGRMKGRRIIYGRHNLPLQRFNSLKLAARSGNDYAKQVFLFFSFSFLLRIMQHPDASVRGTVIHRSLQSEVKTLRSIVELWPTNKRLVHTDWYKLALQ